MLRYLRYTFLALLAVGLVIVAIANRDVVTLRLLPPGMAGFLGFSWQIALPLFLVIFAGILAGILIGFVWEWFREHKHRAEAGRRRREADALKREVARLKTAPNAAEAGDDILALLDDGGATR